MVVELVAEEQKEWGVRYYLHGRDAYLGLVIREKIPKLLQKLVGDFLVPDGEHAVEILELNREERNNTLRSQKEFDLVVNPQTVALRIDVGNVDYSVSFDLGFCYRSKTYPFRVGVYATNY